MKWHISNVRLLPVVLISLGSAVLLSACSDDTPPDSLAFEETASTVVPAPVISVWSTDSLSATSTELVASLDGLDAKYAVIEANLACSRQSNSFAELGGIDELRTEMLAQQGGDDAGHRAFLARMESDSELRSAVTILFLENCPPG